MNNRPHPTLRRTLRGHNAMTGERPASSAPGPRAWPTTRSRSAALADDDADRLDRYAFRQAGNVPDAEDGVQDVVDRGPLSFGSGKAIEAREPGSGWDVRH